MCIFEIQELNITSYKTDMKRLKLGKNWNYRNVALLTVKWVVMKIEFAVQLKLVAALENQRICGPVKLFILLQLQSYQQNIISLGLLRPVLILIKHFACVIYNSRVVLQICPFFDSRVVIYYCKMFRRLAMVVILRKVLLL